MRMRGVCRAFSLLELILVLTIMGVLSAAVAPTMRRFLEAQRLPDAANILSSTIRYCRSTAIHGSVRTRLVFDTETGRIRLETESSPLEQPGHFEELPPPSPLQDILDRNVSEIQMKQMTSLGPRDVDRVEFFPDGSVIGPQGRITDTFIYLRGEDEQEVYTVAIIGITGQVLVMDYEASTFYEIL